jgi:alpha-L-fucosidase
MKKQIGSMGVAGLCALLLQGCVAGIAVQREDSCVIMEPEKIEGNQITVDFELRQPGEYVVQLIHTPESAGKELSASLCVDGSAHESALERESWIEEGIVSTFTSPVHFSEVACPELCRRGKHSLTVECAVTPVKVRVIPKVYWQSRITVGSEKYYREWIKMHESPEKQAAMAWYKKARFGMFIHWGVYSQAAGSWQGKRIEEGQKPFVAEWIMHAFSIPRAEYREFAKQFNPDKSFAVNIAKLAKQTGMKYMVITSKHHDGFALFDSAVSDWDIADSTPYDGDLIQELYDACQAEGIAFGVYYSHGHDWMDGCDANLAIVKEKNDAYGVPTRPNGKNVWDPSPNEYLDYLEGKAYPQVAELVQRMPELKLIWFDGDGLITEAQAFRFYKMIYDLNPNIIVNRRVGYEYGDYMDAGDNTTPKAGELVAKYFETCGTANHSWGFKAHDHAWKTPNQLLRNFVDIISKGGNYLLNIGPDGKGHVPEPCVDSFLAMGKWVETNADAVYGTTRWTRFSENVNPEKDAPAVPGEFWFSARGNKVYAMSITPALETVRIESLNNSAGKVTALRLLGSDAALKWTQNDQALEIDFSQIQTDDNGFVVEAALEE